MKTLAQGCRSAPGSWCAHLHNLLSGTHTWLNTATVYSWVVSQTKSSVLLSHREQEHIPTTEKNWSQISSISENVWLSNSFFQYLSFQLGVTSVRTQIPASLTSGILIRGKIRYFFHSELNPALSIQSIKKCVKICHHGVPQGLTLGLILFGIWACRYIMSPSIRNLFSTTVNDKVGEIHQVKMCVNQLINSCRNSWLQLFAQIPK